MQKKLRGGSYKTKHQFAHDLNLIWDNCFLYNASPTHPLRRNAAFMRKKANHLLGFLSDKNDTQDLLTQWQSATSAHASSAEAPAVEVIEPKTEPELAPASPGPSQSVPFSQRHALRRNPESSLVFCEVNTNLEHIDSGGDIPEGTALEVLRQVQAASTSADPLRSALRHPPQSVQDQWWAACTSDAMLCAGVPVLTHAGRVPTQAPMPSFHSLLPSQRPGIPSRIARNVHTLRRLYSTHHKIHELAEAVELELPIPASLGDVSDDEEEATEPDMPAPLSYDAATPYPRLSNVYARAQASWQVQVLLAHAGFEGAHTSPTQVLADVAAEYLMGLGRTLRMYADRFAHRMAPIEMLEHVLGSCGSSFASLSAYISQDIERYGQRLQEWLRKQKSVLRERLQGVDTSAVDDMDLLARDGEALMLGHFAAGMGDDFFGFRELGLPDLAVPSRLFYGTSHAPIKAAASGKGGANKPALIEPPLPVPLVKCAIPVQIGLLRSWYTSQLNSMDVVPDQVPERPRYKLPTSGKLPPRPMLADVRAAHAANTGDAAAKETPAQAKRKRVA